MVTPDNFQTTTLVFSIVFIIFIPYIVLVAFCYISRKTDDRQPQHILQVHMIVCGIFCVLGSFIFSVSALILESSSLMAKSDGFEKIISYPLVVFMCLMFVIPTIIQTLFYYLLLLTAIQRIVLISKAKVGLQLLTGRRLNFKIAFFYIVALVSATQKCMDPENISILELVTLVSTLLILTLSCALVRHIERKMVAAAHVTVLTQTIPAVLIQVIFTALELMTKHFDLKHFSLHSIRIIGAFVMSIAIPFFIILGSRTKRRIVHAIMTCRWEEQHGRGELYADRTPAEHSNVLSLSPSPTIRF
ncbi:unnamed protein product [Caenorhabditis angaria]|uniref:Uncharacterized protein n=1 Tax=Caenorhabditis angaria TaxID=860376 RepID=A0A9P1N976_9PELO|nr:unnamed protein product [Caenorhabditis angaria]